MLNNLREGRVGHHTPNQIWRGTSAPRFCGYDILGFNVPDFVVLWRLGVMNFCMMTKMGDGTVIYSVDHLQTPFKLWPKGQVLAPRPVGSIGITCWHFSAAVGCLGSVLSKCLSNFSRWFIDDTHVWNVRLYQLTVRKYIYRHVCVRLLYHDLEHVERNGASCLFIPFGPKSPE